MLAEVILPLESIVMTGVPVIDPYVPPVTPEFASVSSPEAAIVASPDIDLTVKPVPLPSSNDPTGAVEPSRPVPPLTGDRSPVTSPVDRSMAETVVSSPPVVVFTKLFALRPLKVIVPDEVIPVAAAIAPAAVT